MNVYNSTMNNFVSFNQIKYIFILQPRTRKLGYIGVTQGYRIPSLHSVRNLYIFYAVSTKLSQDYYYQVPQHILSGFLDSVIFSRVIALCLIFLINTSQHNSSYILHGIFTKLSQKYQCCCTYCQASRFWLFQVDLLVFVYIYLLILPSTTLPTFLMGFSPNFHRNICIKCCSTYCQASQFWLLQAELLVFVYYLLIFIY